MTKQKMLQIAWYFLYLLCQYKIVRGHREYKVRENWVHHKSSSLEKMKALDILTKNLQYLRVFLQDTEV